MFSKTVSSRDAAPEPAGTHSRRVLVKHVLSPAPSVIDDSRRCALSIRIRLDYHQTFLGLDGQVIPRSERLGNVHLEAIHERQLSKCSALGHDRVA